MSNPLIEKNPYFTAGAVRPNQQQTSYADEYVQQYSPAEYQNQYQQQSPYAQGAFGGSAVEHMTYTDAMNKTAILLGSAILAGIATILFFPLQALPAVAIGGSLVTFVLGIIIAVKRVVPGGLALAYSLIEGASLGALTKYIDTFLPGVALQTILATTVIVGVTLMLHYSGVVRTTPRGRKFVLIVAIGGIIFSLVNLGLMAFANTNLRTDISVMGMPLGIILGIVMLLVAAYMLIADFEAVNHAVQNRAPKNFAWTCATAIVMTIFWIYIEVLRIAAIIASDR